LIIPSICIGLWAIYALVDWNFNPMAGDFNIFYDAGRQILINPAKLYEVRGYRYMPSFALFFSISISLIPQKTAAYYVFFIFNYFLGVLTVLLFNKILMLMEVNKSINRFLFLIIISNGYFVYYQFVFNQSKYLTFVILLFILTRELDSIKYYTNKDMRYYFVNYFLFVFAMGMAPYFIFFLIIYLFHDIKKSEILHHINVKKYGLVVLLFVLQNFLFILYPHTVYKFLEGYYRPEKRPQYLKILYLREWVQLTSTQIRIFTLISTTILSLISIILVYMNHLKIEEKFAYFALAYIFIGIFSYEFLLALILFSLVLLLFVPYLNEEFDGIDFIRDNKIPLMGILSIGIIYFAYSKFILFSFIPNLKEFPLNIFYYARWIFLLAIMMSSLILLKYRNKKAGLSLNH
jgi:hypothetical protein